jgi:hypothetical protein
VTGLGFGTRSSHTRIVVAKINVRSAAAAVIIQKLDGRISTGFIEQWIRAVQNFLR